MFFGRDEPEGHGKEGRGFTGMLSRARSDLHKGITQGECMVDLEM